jgi:hypothetical protein
MKPDVIYIYIARTNSDIISRSKVRCTSLPILLYKASGVVCDTMNNLKPKNLLLQFVQGKSYIDRTNQFGKSACEQWWVKMVDILIILFEHCNCLMISHNLTVNFVRPAIREVLDVWLWNLYRMLIRSHINRTQIIIFSSFWVINP